MKISTRMSKAVGLAAIAGAVLGVAAPALASPVPPKASTALLGTWVNTNSATRSVKQIIIAPNENGAVMVDAFGSCTPTLCEWGTVPANVYGPNVSSTTGASFQTNQRFVSGETEWSRTALQGTVGRSATGGLRLTVRELTVFEDGSGRKNYTVTETFVPGKGLPATHSGLSAVGYPLGAPPALVSAALGTWKNVSATGGLTEVKITGTAAAPLVEAFGRCTPTACDWGNVRGITYGASISSTSGTTLLAPYVFSFKKSQLVITFGYNAQRKPTLTIAEYNEFTDGSGRSNYLMTESFVRA